MASTSPVAGRVTMATPPLASATATWSARICSVWYCMARSMVRTRSSPFWAGVNWCSPTGIVWPPGVSSNVSEPGVPVRASAYCASRPGQALVVDVDRAQDGLPQRAGRRRALGLVDEGDAGQAQRGDLVGHRRLDLAGEVGEAVGLAQAGLQVGGVEPQDRGQLQRLTGGIVHQLGVGEDRLLRHRHGQFDVVAVVDGSPLGGQRLGAHRLGLAEGQVLARVEHLEVGDLPGDEQEEAGQAAQQHQQAAAALVAPSRSGGRPRGPGRPGRTAAGADRVERAGEGSARVDRLDRADRPTGVERAALTRPPGLGRARAPGRSWWSRPARALDRPEERTVVVTAWSSWAPSSSAWWSASVFLGAVVVAVVAGVVFLGAVVVAVVAGVVLGAELAGGVVAAARATPPRRPWRRRRRRGRGSRRRWAPPCRACPGRR